MPILYAQLPPPTDDGQTWQSLQPSQLDWRTLHPDKQHNWLDPLSDDFEAFIPLIDAQQGIFAVAYSGIRPLLSHPDKRELIRLAKAHIRQEQQTPPPLLLVTPPPPAVWNEQRICRYTPHPFADPQWAYLPDAPPLLPPVVGCYWILETPHAAAKTFCITADSYPPHADYTRRNYYLPADAAYINPAVVAHFRQYYSQTIRQDELQTAANQVVNSASFLPALRTLAEQIHRLTAQTWTVQHQTELLELTASLLQKSSLLGRGAREKKRLFDALHTALIALQQAIEQAALHHSAQARFLSITAQDIVYYTYDVLQSADYQQQYARHLRYTLPRIPLYPDFWQRVARARNWLQP